MFSCGFNIIIIIVIKLPSFLLLNMTTSMQQVQCLCVGYDWSQWTSVGNTETRIWRRSNEFTWSW